MLGAGAQHGLAVEHHLRPVLVEIGACVPTRGVFVLEDDLADLDGALQAWARDAEASLSLLSLTRGPHPS
jgi:FMN reductase